MIYYGTTIWCQKRNHLDGKKELENGKIDGSVVIQGINTKRSHRKCAHNRNTYTHTVWAVFQVCSTFFYITKFWHWKIIMRLIHFSVSKIERHRKSSLLLKFWHRDNNNNNKKFDWIYFRWLRLRLKLTIHFTWNWILSFNWSWNRKVFMVTLMTLLVWSFLVSLITLIEGEMHSSNNDVHCG